MRFCDYLNYVWLLTLRTNCNVCNIENDSEKKRNTRRKKNGAPIFFVMYVHYEVIYTLTSMKRVSDKKCLSYRSSMQKLHLYTLATDSQMAAIHQVYYIFFLFPFPVRSSISFSVFAFTIVYLVFFLCVLRIFNSPSLYWTLLILALHTEFFFVWFLFIGIG